MEIIDDKKIIKKQKIVGDVKCAKLPKRFSSSKWPVIKNYKNINVCSSSKTFYKYLSPFLLGPITIKTVDYEGNVILQNCEKFENLWQSLKVWDNDLDKDYKIMKSWYDRKNKYFLDKKSHRHIENKRNCKTMFHLWVDQETGKVERLNYIDARKKIYCPIYESLVKNLSYYQNLEKLVNNGTNVQILGYDGYDFTGKTLNECFDDVSKPFGHELCLVGMLKNIRPWSKKIVKK